MWKSGLVLGVLISWIPIMTRGAIKEENIASRYLGAERTIRIYLPRSYMSERKQRYPVLYLHDGQNVFSTAGPNCCFGWGNWAVDVTAEQQAIAGKMREIIIVGIDHSRARYQEYRGPGSARFEAYSKFLTKELKPHIDKTYRTLKAAKHTGVMGSSLGGICSIALAWEQPKTFGMAASLSGSFQIEKKYFLRLLQSYKGKTKPVRLYLDSGAIDFTGDDDGREETEEIVRELRRIGWKDGAKLMHFVDTQTLAEHQMQEAGLPHHKWNEAQKSQHNEFYWRMRAWRPLTFMFPPER